MREPTHATPAPRVGRLEAAFQKMFTRNARVLEIEPVGDRFRLITLGGEALKQVNWTPGDKLQLMLGSWIQRTFTPIEWDAIRGRTRILAYLHGAGPGASWARETRIGDDCVLFGPRRSIDLRTVESPGLLFGDETSLGLAYAFMGLRTTLAHPSVILEMTPSDDLPQIMQALGLEHVDIHLRCPDDAHLPAVEARALHRLKTQPGQSFVLTGKSTSIQYMRRALRGEGIPAGRFHNKAYWAPGKTGLD